MIPISKIHRCTPWSKLNRAGRKTSYFQEDVCFHFIEDGRSIYSSHGALCAILCSIMNFKLRTDRLFLRLVQDCDAEPAFDILHSHPDITRFMTFNPPKKVDDTLQFFRESRLHCPEKGVVWALFLEEKFIGLVSLESITRMLGVWKMDRAELGYWLDPSFHGQGIMTEAASEVMRFGFEHLNLHKIICGHVSENIASQKVIEKLGFRFLSERKEHFFRFGQWWNHKNYEIIKDEFESS